MKKLLFTLCCMIFAIASFAQSNVHIKFMGIPVTGTIAQFQAKLVAKGCTYNKVASASISNGTRAFNGTFVGNKVDFTMIPTQRSSIGQKLWSAVFPKI